MNYNNIVIWFYLNQHLLCQRHIPRAHFISRGRMTAWKMETPFVVLQEERFEVGKCVLLAKQAPDAVFAKRIA